MARPDKLRILGVDPGSRATGYGVIEKDGNRLQYVACGVIRATSSMTFHERLKTIHEGLSEVITVHAPVIAAVEDVFVALNPRSALKLGHARGVAILAAMQHGLAVHDYTPRMIKQAVVGFGNAEKAQVQQMVRILLRLSVSPSADAADALAAAICHANQPLVNGESVNR